MKTNKTIWMTLALISQLGLGMVVPVFLCAFIGEKLDERFGWACTLPLILVGVLAGIRNTYALIKQAKKRIEAGKDDEDDEV